MSLEKSPLAANGRTKLTKREIGIQSAFDLEYTCGHELMICVSDSSEAQKNSLGIDFLAKIGEIFNLKHSMLTLTVFPGKCVKLPAYLDKLFPYISQLTL